MVSFDAHAPGTPAEAWDADPRRAAAPRADLSGMRELVVVAAHPDDETLGCGGLIALAGEAGIPVRLLVVTDGAASHPRSRTVTAQQLRARRAEELRTAAGRLAHDVRVSWFGFPDGRTQDFTREIAARLEEELAELPDGVCVAVVWSGDGHRDHRIVGELVERIVPAGTALWAYPIWMWHWASPGGDDVPWERALAVLLPAEIRRRKQHALSAFASQLAPLSTSAGDERVLEAGILEHFARDTELFFAREPAWSGAES